MGAPAQTALVVSCGRFWSSKSACVIREQRRVSAYIGKGQAYRVLAFLTPSITTPSANGIVSAIRSSGPKFLVM